MTQGKQVKDSCCDETCEVFIVPTGGFAFEVYGIFGGRPPLKVVGHMPQLREVGRGVLGPDAAFIIAEHHVHDPMKAVLRRPMVSDHGAYGAGK